MQDLAQFLRFNKSREMTELPYAFQQVSKPNLADLFARFQNHPAYSQPPLLKGGQGGILKG